MKQESFTLDKDEKILCELKHHWFAYFPLLFFSILLASILFALLPVAIYLVVKRRDHRLILTNKRFILICGWRANDIGTIRLEKVDGIYSETSFLGGIFNYKDVYVNSGGQSLLLGITKNADELLRMYDEIIQKREDDIKVRQAGRVMNDVVMPSIDDIGNQLGEKIADKLNKTMTTNTDGNN